jgi:hypothetical protein
MVGFRKKASHHPLLVVGLLVVEHGYDVTTRCFQQSYTINTLVHSFFYTEEGGGVDWLWDVIQDTVGLFVNNNQEFRRLGGQTYNEQHSSKSPIRDAHGHHPIQCKIFRQNRLPCYENVGLVYVPS